MNPLTMFGQNIRLFIGILACIGVAIAIGLVIYIAVRVIYASRQQRTNVARFEKSRLDARGNPLPPDGMGVCQVCGKALPNVFFLPDGSRRCRACPDAPDL